MLFLQINLGGEKDAFRAFDQNFITSNMSLQKAAIAIISVRHPQPILITGLFARGLPPCFF